MDAKVEAVRLAGEAVEIQDYDPGCDEHNYSFILTVTGALITIDENSGASSPTASEYILDNFEPIDRIAMLVLNRDLGEVLQRITSAKKASSPEFQAWQRYKNATGSDIYIGMNSLRKHASTRTKEDIKSIR